MFAIFKNVVHSLEPGETLSDCVSPGFKLCATFFNTAKYFKTVRCGCGVVAFIYLIYLKLGLYKSKVGKPKTLTLSPPNKLSAKFLVFFNFQSASMWRKVVETFGLSDKQL